MPYKCLFVIARFFTNGLVNVKFGAVQVNYSIRHVKPYKSDTKVEDISSKNMSDNVNT